MRRLLLTLLLLLSLPLAAGSFKASDGVTLHYDVVGKGTPVVLLSGGPGFSPDYLRPIAERLAGSHSFVLFHQRGTGRSKIAEYNATTMALPRLAADLEELRRGLGIEKLTIVAHSWGGILTMLYASDHPERIARIAFVGSGGPTLASTASLGINLNLRLTDVEKAKIKEWSDPKRIEADRKLAVLELTKASAPAYFADRSKAALLTGPMDRDSFNDEAFRAILPQIGLDFDLRGKLAELPAAVLIIHGKQDPLESSGELHEAFPASKLELLEGAGHFPWLEQPEKLFALLETFLDDGSAKIVER